MALGNWFAKNGARPRRSLCLNDGKKERLYNTAAAYLRRDAGCLVLAVGTAAAELRCYWRGVLLEVQSRPLPPELTAASDREREELLYALLLSLWEEMAQAREQLRTGEIKTAGAEEGLISGLPVIILLEDGSVRQNTAPLPSLSPAGLYEAVQWELPQYFPRALQQQGYVWQALLLDEETALALTPQQNIFAGLEAELEDDIYGNSPDASADSEKTLAAGSAPYGEQVQVLVIALPKEELAFWQRLCRRLSWRLEGISLPELWQERRLAVQLNLLPFSQRPALLLTARPWLERQCRRACGLFLFILLAVCGIAFFLRQQAAAELSQARIELQQLALWPQRRQEFVGLQQRRTALAKKIEMAAGKALLWHQELALFSKLAPPNLWLTEAAEVADKRESGGKGSAGTQAKMLLLKGKAADMQAITRFMNALTQNGGYQQAELAEAHDGGSEGRAANGRPLIVYTLRLHKQNTQTAQGREER